MNPLENDPDCYPGTSVLKNNRDLRDQAQLDTFEKIAVAVRAEEPLPRGKYGAVHFCAIHKHLFQDVYFWAGQYRKIKISKGGDPFCSPEYIDSQMTALFADLAEKGFLCGLDGENFCKEGAHFLAELNAIHPFREGNGRVQRAYFQLISYRAGWPLIFERLDPIPFLDAMIESFTGSEDALVAQLRILTGLD